MSEKLQPPPPPPRRLVPARPTTHDPTLPSARTTSEFAPPPTNPHTGKIVPGVGISSGAGGYQTGSVGKLPFIVKSGSGSGGGGTGSGSITPPTGAGDKKSWKDRGKGWGNKAYEKGFQLSDALGGRVNGYAEKLGSERFWPTTGDFPEEMDKAARILRAFTVVGLETKIEVDVVQADGKKTKKPRKVHRKIPPAVLKSALGLVIFTSMRSGLAPFGGAGGTGVAVARLPDGSWSAPSALSPNNLSTGLMIGVDVYDCVLVIRTPEALASFASHNFTLGTDIGIVAGPFGAGAAMEAGKDRTPVYSYVRSRGLYAGVQLVGQVFVDRYEENAKMYHYPGIKAGDILSGRVKVPREAARLVEALEAAESGQAQAEKGNELDEFVVEGLDDLQLEDGEVLHLPPTPEQAEADYGDHEKLDARSTLEKEATRHSLSQSQELVRVHGEGADEPAPVYTFEQGLHTPGPEKVSGLGYEEMDESTRRELEQHLEQQRQEQGANSEVPTERRVLAEQGRSTSGLSDASRYSFEDAPEYVASLGPPVQSSDHKPETHAVV